VNHSEPVTELWVSESDEHGDKDDKTKNILSNKVLNALTSAEMYDHGEENEERCSPDCPLIVVISGDDLQNFRKFFIFDQGINHYESSIKKELKEVACP
jgi:hypothetical protein